MHYQRAVQKLRMLAEGCQEVKNWQPGEPFLLEAHVFGEVLQGIDPLECVEVALVVNLPPEEVTWGSNPPGTLWLADRLRLDKGGYRYWWRSRMSPVWSHYIQGPVRFWSQNGTDDAVLRALAERRFSDLPRWQPQAGALREQLAAELATALGHLRSVYASYWDNGWRHDHRGYGRYPENELWEAVDSYLDLLDAAEPDAADD